MPVFIVKEAASLPVQAVSQSAGPTARHDGCPDRSARLDVLVHEPLDFVPLFELN